MSFFDSESYDFIQTLEYAVAAYRHQGYVKVSNAKLDKNQFTNKNLVYGNLIRKDPDLMRKFEVLPSYMKADFVTEVPILMVLPSDVEKAKEIADFYSEEYTLAKLSDTLDDFGKRVDSMILADNVMANQIGLIASLPFSYDKLNTHRKVEKFYQDHRAINSGYFGSPRQRFENLVLTVIDVYFFKRESWDSKESVYMIVFETECGKIIKSFNPDEKIVAPFQEWLGKKVELSATVKGHYFNKKYECRETIIHKIKGTKFLSE